ncbi:hypothetical protein HU200_025642 [Digitaria exilis]|uniref:Uncharacterized protein n=1 Tax=Digitaria exilis TaxID=1010633 RepID=A0A835C2P4_9POAL|nr:hypothetical protein HU200_025642 [Digitaria exilis]
MEDEYNASTISKADGIATPLRDAGFAYDIYLVKGDELQKRLCLEIKRLEVKGIGLNALIIGGKTFGSAPGTSKGTLDHYVHLNACPVIVVPTLLEARRRMGEAGDLSSALDTVDGLHPVPEEKVKYHDVSYPQQGN